MKWGMKSIALKDILILNFLLSAVKIAAVRWDQGSVI